MRPIRQIRRRRDVRQVAAPGAKFAVYDFLVFLVVAAYAPAPADDDDDSKVI